MFDTPGQPATDLAPQLAELMHIASERRRLDAREAELLADPAVALECVSEHGHRTPQWLAIATYVSSSSASARVRTAQRIHTYFPTLVDSLRKGIIGWNHVAFFNRVANPRIRTEMAQLVEPIVDLAQVTTFDRWCREVRGIAERLDQDGGFNPDDDPAHNWLKLTPTYDGAIDVSGRLVGELGFRISKLVQAETDRVMARHRHDAEHVQPSDGWVDLPSHAQACAEALGEMIDRAAGTPDGDGQMPTPEMVVVHNSDTLHLADDAGNQLPQSMLRWLLAAALVRPLEVSGTGDPLRMGRALRYANREQRRALAVRDGGCVFPGCDRPPSWCDAHHVDHWDEGGHTDIEAMALLCRHHHRVTHRPGWSMTATPDAQGSQFVWTTPGGRTLCSQRHRSHAPPMVH